MAETIFPSVGRPLLIPEHASFMVPGFLARVGAGGSTSLESIQTDALQISRAHHHSDEILPQGDVERVPPSFLLCTFLAMQDIGFFSLKTGVLVNTVRMNIGIFEHRGHNAVVPCPLVWGFKADRRVLF